MPFVPSHLRTKSQPQSNEVQVTESTPQQAQQSAPFVEQAPTNEVRHQVEQNGYDYESELEDLLVTILYEMTVIKKMISQSQSTTAHAATDEQKPAVEIEKLLPSKQATANAQDFSDCF
jgi:hypothetical protein